MENTVYQFKHLITQDRIDISGEDRILKECACEFINQMPLDILKKIFNVKKEHQRDWCDLPIEEYTLSYLDGSIDEFVDSQVPLDSDFNEAMNTLSDSKIDDEPSKKRF